MGNRIDTDTALRVIGIERWHRRPPPAPAIEPETAAAAATREKIQQSRPQQVKALDSLQLQLFRSGNWALLQPAPERKGQYDRLGRGIVHAASEKSERASSSIAKVLIQDKKQPIADIAGFLQGLISGNSQLRLIVLGELLKETVTANPTLGAATPICAPEAKVLAVSAQEKQKLWQQILASRPSRSDKNEDKPAATNKAS